MDGIVDSLSDERARRILGRIARARLHQGGQAIALDRELVRALAEEFTVAPGGVAASEGEVAREALRVLSEEPGTAEAIATMAENLPGRGEKFVEPETIALATAAILVLQTHVRIEFKDGRWSFLGERKAAKDSLVRPLVEKLVGLFTSGSAG